MHDQSFPTSDEDPAKRTERAIEALKYEESAKIGFRRRAMGEQAGDPYAHPDDYLVARGPVTGAQILANYLAGMSVVLGAAAIAYRPLLLAIIAALCGVMGSIGGGMAGRIAKLGIVISCFGFFIGMLVAITLEQPIL